MPMCGYTLEIYAPRNYCCPCELSFKVSKTFYFNVLEGTKNVFFFFFRINKGCNTLSWLCFFRRVPDTPIGYRPVQ